MPPPVSTVISNQLAHEMATFSASRSNLKNINDKRKTKEFVSNACFDGLAPLCRRRAPRKLALVGPVFNPKTAHVTGTQCLLCWFTPCEDDENAPLNAHGIICKANRLLLQPVYGQLLAAVFAAVSYIDIQHLPIWEHTDSWSLGGARAHVCFSHIKMQRACARSQTNAARALMSDICMSMCVRVR